MRLHGGSVYDEFERRWGASAKDPCREVVCASGAVVTPATVLPAGARVFFYRELPTVEVPFDIPVLYRDDDIVVVDKSLPGHHAAGPARRADRAVVRCGARWGCPSFRRRIGWTG